MTHLVFPPKSEYESHATALEAIIAADRPEMEFRTYFTVNPWILSLAFGHGEGAVFSEYELAPGQRPDHLLLGGRSRLAYVTLIELKLPSAGLLKANGSMTESLNNAISKTVQRRTLLVEGEQHYLSIFTRQIDDLVSGRRAHFKGVVDRFIGSKLRLPLEDYHVWAKIIIGSRGRQSEEERRFRGSYFDPAGNVEIVPFDRVLDFLRYPPHEAQTIEWLPARKAERRAYWEEERRKRSDIVFVVPVHDEELSYRSWRGTEGRFWARIFEGPAGTVALLTDIPYGDARPSVTNNIERAAQCVCERFGLEGRAITFVEHYDNRDERLALNFVSAWKPETFDQVTFEVLPSRPGERFARPKWVEMTKSDIERLVGGNLP
jgi:antiviral defense system Shedu protein SduA